MAKIPISITKIKIEKLANSYTGVGNTHEAVFYLLKIVDKGQEWEKTYTCSREELIKFRNEIDHHIVTETSAEILGITSDKSKVIDEHHKEDNLCQNCSFKMTRKCIECIFVLQSPLERKLYLELSKNFINFQIQYALNWNGQHISIEGKSYYNTQNNFREVLTVPDFYIDKKQTKLCVYTDGHTYHERTEEQAQRDRNIDRKLQELGFQVLRYTGKEVNENMEKIINEIKKWIA